MHIADVDQLALSDKSFIHRLAPLSKISFSFLLLIALMFNQNISRLMVLVLLLIVILLSSGLKLKSIFHFMLYPLFFSGLFALFSLSQGWEMALVIVLKAMGAALSMLLLITTTPYVHLFGFFSKFMPALLIDLFLMTYRSFFILTDQLSHLLVTVKLRGGYKPLTLIKNIKTVVALLGTMIIHSFEMSDRMYKIYLLRGYNGKIPLVVDMKPRSSRDFLWILFGAIILVGAIR